MKEYYRAILILGICGSLCGCGGPAGYQRKETDTASIKSRFEIPEMIETELADNITIKAQVTIPQNAKSGTVTCAIGKPMDFSGMEEKLRTTFFAGSQDAVFETAGDTVSLAADSVWLGYNELRDFVLNSREMEQRLNCISVGGVIETSNARQYLEKENLPFMDQKEVLQLVQKELGELGIHIGSVEVCYVMDYETMRQQEDTTNAAGILKPELAKEQWSEQDDTYYFFMHQEYHGMPVIYNPYSGQGFLPGEECTVMVSEKGIIGCHVAGCYSWSEGEEAVLLPMEKVLKTLKDHYGNDLVTHYEITSADFYMDILPKSDGTAELRPVWSFLAEKTGEGIEDFYTVNIVIDGETGQELTENF